MSFTFDFAGCSAQEATEAMQAIIETGVLVGISDPTEETLLFVNRMIEAGWSADKAHRCRQNAATFSFQDVKGSQGVGLKIRRTKTKPIVRKSDVLKAALQRTLRESAAYKKMRDDESFKELLIAPRERWKVLLDSLYEKYTKGEVIQAWRFSMRLIPQPL